jgi:hypothetical protein
MQNNKTLLFLIENNPCAVFFNIILVVYLFYVLVGRFCEENSDFIPKKQAKNSFTTLFFDSLVFVVIAWLLNYLFNIDSFFKEPELHSVESWIKNIKNERYSNPYSQQHPSAVVTWILFLGYSLVNVSLLSVISNLMLNIIFSSVYIFFNIQFGFVSLAIVFFSYSGLNQPNFELYFFLIPITIIISWIFFKLKKKLLNKVRAYFASLKPHQLALRKVKIGEFYLICAPYIIYSTLFNIVVLENLFNLLIQLIAAHLFSYFVIFKLYKAGHDMGFDYDPF